MGGGGAVTAACYWKPYMYSTYALVGFFFLSVALGCEERPQRSAWGV